MSKPPLPPGTPSNKVLEARKLSDGRWLLKISNKKGEGDFRVTVFDPKEGWLTPSYAHFAIDMFCKLGASQKSAAKLLAAVERVFEGSPARKILTQLKKQSDAKKLDSLPGYTVEYTLHALEFIFAQEDVNWDRDDMASKPLPSVRKSLIRQNVLNSEEAKRGSGLALALLRRIVRDRRHPVEAMRQAQLRI